MNTVASAALSEGDWFWHEPWPGYRAALLRAVTVHVGDSTVRISTADSEREEVSYRLDRSIQLDVAP